MGRPFKEVTFGELWQAKVVADFKQRYPQGMFRPVEVEADPAARIEEMPWWEGRPALMLIGCSDAAWDEACLLRWAAAVAAAAESRGSVVEIACGAEGAGANVDFGKLGSGFRWRRRPDKPLGSLSRMRAMPGGHPPLTYFHVVRIPAEQDRPPPLTASELISSFG